MRIRYYILLTLLLFGALKSHSAESFITIVADVRADSLPVSSQRLRDVKRHTDIEIHFKLDNSELDLDYMGNAASFRRFAAFIDSVGVAHIDSVVIMSQSSPEGYYGRNMKLSEERANAMRKYLLEAHPDLSGRLYVSPDGESWGRLREYVENDTVIKSGEKEKVLSIIDADVNLETKKWRMKQRPVYEYLYKKYYPLIRNSKFHILYFTYSEAPKAEPVAVSDTVVPQPEPADTVVAEPPVVETDAWVPRLHIKTNAVGLGMGIANLAVEVDLARHWSFTLPVYYSAWNYFKETLKFRTFAIQPEVRYWPSRENTGLFAGAHFGWGYYNFAFGGEYRYQDRSAKTPAIGGGLSLGYRLPLSKNRKWNMEIAIGAGCYSLHYDKFHNTASTKEGLLVESARETYWGIDQAALTFSYAFDLKKKGGKR